MAVPMDKSAAQSLLERFGLRPNKALGQNFLVNPGVCDRIAREGGARPGVCALEIGPGLGALTARLADACDRVVAVELDSGLIPVLAESLADYDNIRIIHGDILKQDLSRLMEQEFRGMPAIVCANLPYYVTTPIVMALLEARLPLESITVMLQKETARRICAPMPSRQSGAITAAVRFYTEPKLLFGVSPGSFWPAPGVDSEVVRLDLQGHPRVKVSDDALLFKVIRAAYSQRRKMLRGSLAAGLRLSGADAVSILRAAQVDETLRPEQLALEDFARIADALHARTKPAE